MMKLKLTHRLRGDYAYVGLYVVCSGICCGRGIYICLMIKKKQLTKDRIVNMIFRWAFAGYLCFIAAVTLFPITLPPCRMPFITPSVNLDPGMLFRYGDAWHMIVNIAGNLLLFVPGVILGRLCRIKVLESWQSTLAAGAAASVLIEVLQYCETVWGFTDMPRISDINDVALNTAGAVIGWFVFRLYDKRKKSA